MGEVKQRYSKWVLIFQKKVCMTMSNAQNLQCFHYKDIYNRWFIFKIFSHEKTMDNLVSDWSTYPSPRMENTPVK